MSAEIVPFVPKRRSRRSRESPLPSRSPAPPDDLVMDHADTAPCEYSPWCDVRHVDYEPG